MKDIFPGGGVAAQAAQAASALTGGLRRVFQRVRPLAMRDPMTGAFDAEGFRGQFVQAHAAARADGATLLLGLVDLDHFRQVNDQLGHRAGDNALRAFAVGAAALLRDRDLFGRVGGDEFALLIRMESPMKGDALARLLHWRLSEVLARSRHPLTCSMGAVIVLPDNPADADILMEQADRALHLAKRRGRNRVKAGWATTPPGEAASEQRGTEN